MIQLGICCVTDYDIHYVLLKDRTKVLKEFAINAKTESFYQRSVSIIHQCEPDEICIQYSPSVVVKYDLFEKMCYGTVKFIFGIHSKTPQIAFVDNDCLVYQKKYIDPIIDKQIDSVIIDDSVIMDEWIRDNKKAIKTIYIADYLYENLSFL